MTVEVSIRAPVATRWPAGGRTSNLLLLALGPALIGRVSLYSGRGGFIGAILGVGLIVVLNSWMSFGESGSAGVHLGLFAVVIIVGPLVIRAIGLIARAIDTQLEAPLVVVPSAVASPAVSSAAGAPEPVGGLL